MMLANYHHDKNYLFLPHEDKLYSFQDAIEEAKKYDTKLIGIKVRSLEELSHCNQFPIVVNLREKSHAPHSVLVTKINKRFVYYYDDESRAISENNIAMLSAVARWHDNQEDGNGAYTRHTRVGCYQPNAWGLYDMHGNVFEWCLDLYGSYESEEVADPVGPVIGNSRVCRGASWKTEDMDKFRAAYRWHTPSNTVSPDIGFRIVWYR